MNSEIVDVHWPELLWAALIIGGTIVGLAVARWPRRWLPEGDEDIEVRAPPLGDSLVHVTPRGQEDDAIPDPKLPDSPREPLC